MIVNDLLGNDWFYDCDKIAGDMIQKHRRPQKFVLNKCDLMIITGEYYLSTW